MTRKRTLNIYVLSHLIPAFLAAIFFFSLLLELMDLFTNLVKYIQNEAEPGQVFAIMGLYLPRCVSLSLAPALLFASAYAFGTLRTSNELIVIHGSGVSLASFAIPVLVFAGLISVGGLFFEDSVALPALKAKNDQSRTLLGQRVTLNNAEIALLNKNEGLVWTADYFNFEDSSLSGITVIQRDKAGKFLGRIDARRAVWDKDRWIFQDARRWFFGSDGTLTESVEAKWDDPIYHEPPASFRKGKKNLDELNIVEARDYVYFLKAAGLPYGGSLAEYYERFTFGLTPLVVTLLSIGAGGRLRKNVLFSSLLLSLAAATAYYVIRMMTMLFARLDLVAPIFGAATPVIVFLGVGVVLFRTART
jgi:lipopolysaccharide export system permease protein